MTIPKNTIFWTTTTLATLFFAFWTGIFFMEWWTIKINKQTGGYPWGQVSENPWFYDNPNLYANVILTETLLLSLPIGLTVYFMLRRNKLGTGYALLCCLIAFLLTFVNGNIQS